MKKHFLVLLLAGLVLAFVPALHAQWLTQSLNLQAGWNAVYLSIAPAPVDCDSLFGENPRIVSVRQWAPPPIQAVQFDEVTGATLPQSGSWLTWFPPNHPDRALLNLALVTGNAAYLIEVSDGSPVVLNLQGRPMVMAYEWQPGAYHFLGLPAYSSSITFSTFFAAANGNILVDYRTGGELYTVLANGAHQRIFTPTTTTITPGKAYWVKAQQYSTYAGPVGVKLGTSASWMDFGRRLVPQYIEISNTTNGTRGVKLAHLASGAPPAGTPALAGPVPLKYAIVTGASEAQGRVWLNLPSTWTTQLVAGASLRLAFLPNAGALTFGDTNAAYQSVLEVTDDTGTAGAVRQRIGVRAMARSGSGTESRGLWVGEVTVTNVGRVGMPGVSDPFTLKPVARPFTFRLLAHVDGNGAARLLQRVFVGTRPDPANSGIITDLMATEGGVSTYKAQHPDAKVFRLSSANFPFMDPSPMTNGIFGVPNQTVSGSVEVGRNDPVNPFLHPYSPLHDNLEQRAEDRFPYEGDVEVFSVRREIDLVFKGLDEVNPEPRWGETVCGGVYNEKIYGLGGPLDAPNRMITIRGRFVLQRASTVGTLQ